MVARRLRRLLMVAGQLVGLALAGSGGAQPFTDDPIVPGSTPVRAVHFMELRSRIDVLRSAAGMEPYAWTDPVLAPGVTRVKAVHLTELRAALADAYVRAGHPRPIYTELIRAGTTPVHAAHVMELRVAVVNLEDGPTRPGGVEIRAQYAGLRSPNAWCDDPPPPPPFEPRGVSCVVGFVSVDETPRGPPSIVSRFYSSRGSLVAEASSFPFYIVAGVTQEFYVRVTNSDLRGWDGWFTTHLVLDGEEPPCPRCGNQYPQMYRPFGWPISLLFFRRVGPMQTPQWMPFVSLRRGEQEFVELMFTELVGQQQIHVLASQEAVLHNSDASVISVGYSREHGKILIRGLEEGGSTVTASYLDYVETLEVAVRE